jgi:hypothetical protein
MKTLLDMWMGRSSRVNIVLAIALCPCYEAYRDLSSFLFAAGGPDGKLCHLPFPAINLPARLTARI